MLCKDRYTTDSTNSFAMTRLITGVGKNTQQVYVSNVPSLIVNSSDKMYLSLEMRKICFLRCVYVVVLCFFLVLFGGHY